MEKKDGYLTGRDTAHSGVVTTREIRKSFEELWNKAPDQDVITLYKDTPLSEVRNLFPKPNSKASKRKARLNTCAGLPAKRRSLKKSLKRHWKKLGLKVQNVPFAMHLLGIDRGYTGLAMSLLKEHTLHLGSGNLTSGYVATLATMPGMEKDAHDYQILLPKNWGLKNSSNDFIIPYITS